MCFLCVGGVEVSSGLNFLFTFNSSVLNFYKMNFLSPLFTNLVVTNAFKSMPNRDDVHVIADHCEQIQVFI